MAIRSFCRSFAAYGVVTLSVLIAPCAPSLAAATTDCPMAFEPYSADTIFYDLTLNPATQAILRENMPELTAKFGPEFLKPSVPSFAIITTPRLLARMLSMDPALVDKINAELAGVEVSTQAAQARCARYDHTPPSVPASVKSPAVLVFTKIHGFHHGPSVDAATQAIRSIAERKGWSVYVSDNGAIFNPRDLARFKAILWNNVSGDVLTVGQRDAFESYIEGGGGFVGFHGSGGDPFYRWTWFGKSLIGAQFIGHPSNPQFQEARIVIDDPNDAVVRGIGEWTLLEEWYSYESSPRLTGAHILATIDERSYDPSTPLRMGDDHPIIWKRCVGDGRSFYSAIGHRTENFSEPRNLQILERGIIWAAGMGETGCRNGAEVKTKRVAK